MLLCFASLYRLKNLNKNNYNFSLLQKYSDFTNRKFFPLNQTTLLIYFLSFSFFAFLMLIHLNYMNLNLLWMNNQYKLLSNATALQLPLAASLINVLAGIFAIVLLIIIILLIKSGRYFMAIGLLPMFLYFFTLKIAANSRWGPLIVASSIPFLYKRGSLKSMLLIFFTAFFSLMFFLGVLFGRNGGTNTQGISAIYSNISNGINGAAFLFPKILGSTFSGAWNFDLTLQKFDSKTVVYDAEYKLLAFSPLPSTLDGYDEIKDRNILKILSYAPVGAFGELYYFGILYFLLFLLFLFFSLRFCNRVVIKHNLLGILVVSPFYLFFLKIQEYPIRNSFRYILLALVAGYILNKLRSTNKQIA